MQRLLQLFFVVGCVAIVAYVNTARAEGIRCNVYNLDEDFYNPPHLRHILYELHRLPRALAPVGSYALEGSVYRVCNRGGCRQNTDSIGSSQGVWVMA